MTVVVFECNGAAFLKGFIQNSASNIVDIVNSHMLLLANS